MSVYRLKVRNTGCFIKVDPKDWGTVRDTMWFYHKEMDIICTRSGVPYEEIAGFPEGFKNRIGNVYDKVREHLIPNDCEWVFDESKTTYVVRKIK